MRILTVFEQIILASIITLKGDAYGVSIRKRAIAGKKNPIIVRGPTKQAVICRVF